MSNDRMKSLLRQHPARIPVSASILPAAWMKHRDKLEEIVKQHPLLFGASKGDRDYDHLWSQTYAAGEHVDAFGCVWSNIKTGMEAIVTRHPLPTRDSVRAFKIPEKDIGFPHGFMFLRLTDLRGFEEVMVDFAEEPPELRILIDRVLDYNLRQAAIKVKDVKPGQTVYFGDDLGMQHSLPVSPATWRKYLKPCYQAIYKPFKDAGAYVYMHTDGHIHEIIPDLIDCGVDIINPQVGANGLDNLARVCKGKVCVDLDLDRQQFPFWTPNEIDAHIHESVEALWQPEGGLWLKAEIGDDVPLANIEAICEALEKYSTY